MRGLLPKTFVLLAGICVCRGEIDWPQLKFTLVASNLVQPTSVVHAGDGSGRLFITQQSGQILTLSGTTLDAIPFLDIGSKIILGSEQGLLCVAFPPDYVNKRHFYVNYTRAGDGATIVSRFSVKNSDNIADPSSEEVILNIPQPFVNHNGGQLVFGPDGYLYVGTGDGGGAGDPGNRAQDLGSLLGKILRIDVDQGTPYSIPPTNPFLTNSSARPEIWAYGLRNPWRFSFDRETGDLYIADVGQDAWEEVDFQPANSAGGENYGWRLKEGSHDFNLTGALVDINALIRPVAEYGHETGGSITGGYVCRRPGASRLHGIYFFGDFISTKIFGLRFDQAWRMADLGRGLRFSTFGEDEAGNVYAADYSGKIYLLEDNGATAAPGFSPLPGNSPGEIITINSLTPNSTIRYTLDARNPIGSDPAVSPGDSIIITNGSTIRAQAFRSDLLPSLVSTGTFNFVVGTPQFSDILPSRALFSIPSNSLMIITCATPNANVYYTLDSSTPGTNSPLYAGPFIITPPKTLRARGFRPGFVDSPVRSVSFSLASVPMPGLSPAAGPITNGTQIRAGCAAPDAQIFYTLDGVDPTTNSIKYIAPFLIQGNTTVKARAFVDNYQPSAVNSVLFGLVAVATPVFTPGSGPITNGTLVTIACATPDAQIFYTLDQTDPTTNSINYAGPFVIQGNTRVKAQAFAAYYAPSAIKDVFYDLVRVATPVFTPASGPITNGTPVSITTATAGAAIYYTLDGTTPTTNSAVYTQPLVFPPNATLSAIAIKSDYNDSVVQSTFYALVIREKTVVTTIAGSGQPEFRDGDGIFARFNSPSGLWLDPSDSLYIADTGNNRIRKLLPGGEVLTVAGSGVAGNLDGQGTNAQFNMPVGICKDAMGNLYITDRGNYDSIRKITPAGDVSTVVTIGGVGLSPAMWQIDVDPAGTVYFGHWCRLSKVDTNGVFAYVAGTGVNGPGGWGPTVGLGLDSLGNVFVTTSGRLAKVYPDGTDETYVGWGPAVADGARLQAGFANPLDCVVDALGNIYVSDDVWIRRVSTNGIVSTVAGTGVAGYVSGASDKAQFRSASAICVDTNGNLYVADAGNNGIRRISIDSDSDGIPDFEETLASGFLVGVDDRKVDSDGDGQSNADEYVAGTNPLSAASHFNIKSVDRLENNLILSWDAAANRMYQLSSSSNLAWWDFVTNIPSASAGTISVALTGVTNATLNSFYRLSVWLP